MIFHSLDFVGFFIAVMAIYWLLPHRAQNLLLLGASYLFYGYVHPWFLILIAASTIVDYYAARAMERWPARKRLLVWASVVSNLGMLAFFKYFNFFVESVTSVLTAAGWDTNPTLLRIMLPVGISFYTFQTLSYTIDVYRGEMSARASLLDFAVFVSLFPQLVAGPIVRASYLLPQVEARRRFSSNAARTGLLKICWGFFKKLVIADNVGVVANKVFALSDPTFPILWAGVFAFAIQICADFSAYTDIARGTSRLLGFELPENFDHPYLARSPSDFWRRWHISLSTWFRDYVYVPLGGSRGGEGKWARNILFTFLLSGLWHGASWNYVLWGLYHGLLLIATRARAMMKPLRVDGGVDRQAPGDRAARWRQWPLLRPLVICLQTIGMFVLTLIGWLVFRETELTALVRDFALSPFAAPEADYRIALYLFLLALVYSVPLWVQGIWVEGGRDPRGRTQPEATAANWGEIALQGVACGVALAGILVFHSTTSLDFIYFQF
ncbi:MAG: MBOAT family protein [Acidobacteria bacterium]|nr:MBOAT family protein [Acidobacteriota bacterium]